METAELELWSDDNDYPAICESCGADIIIEAPLMAQYACLSLVSGVTGKFIQSEECRNTK